MPARRFYTLWPSYIVLAASLSVTVLASAYIKKSIDAEEEAKLDSTTKLVQQTLASEIERYTDVLLAARSFFDSSEAVTRSDWRTFCSSLNLQTRFPGMLTLGFGPIVSHDALPLYVDGVRREGFPEFNVFPAGDRASYTPNTYIEPFTPTNRRVLGFDMSSEPLRRHALNDAAQNDVPVATAPLKLLQDATPALHSSFVIFVAVYRHRAPLETPEQRSAALLGFVYSAYRVPQLIQGVITGREQFRQVDFEVFDGSVRDPEKLMFDSREVAGKAAPAMMSPNDGPVRERVAPIDVATRKWTLIVRPSQNFLAGVDHDLPWLVLLGGGFASWLLFGVSWLQMRARAQSDFAATRLAESETLLRESELRYRLKIEQSPLAVQTLAPNGTTISINRAWEELWGLSLEDLHGYNIIDDPELDRANVKHLIHGAFAGSSVSLGTFYYSPPPLPSGKRARARWVRSFLYPVKDLHGHIKELVLIHQDVTDRKQAEEDLRRAKETAEAANHAKDQFLAVLSHELRNPLSPVLSMVNLLQSPSVSPEETREALDVIRRNVELEARLIDDLLDVTRIARGKLHLDYEVTDAHTMLQHSLQICREEADVKRLRVNVELNAKEHVLKADPARLQQVCWNLIKNAVKFTPDGGEITISTRNETADDSVDGDKQLVISVSDTGIGIDPQKLPNIFDAFEQVDRSITRRFGGLGLGLAITKALVDAHRGTITAASDGLGKGATFIVRLPVTKEAAMQKASSTPAPGAVLSAAGVSNANGGKRPRILLVEDQPDARRGLRILMEHHSYEVRAAATAGEALAIARDWPYDLLVSDIGLPDLSGFDLLLRLREICSTPAIALTGFGMEEDVQRARQAGFQQHLTKPIQFERLEQAIRTLLADQPANA